MPMGWAGDVHCRNPSRWLSRACKAVRRGDRTHLVLLTSHLMAFLCKLRHCLGGYKEAEIHGDPQNEGMGLSGGKKPSAQYLFEGLQ